MSSPRSNPLTYLSIALIASALVSLIFGVLQTRAFINLVTSTDPGANGDSLATLYRVSSVGHLALAAAITALCLLCLSGSIDSTNRGLWIAAAALNALVALEILAGLLTQLAGSNDPLLWRLYKHTWFRLLAIAVDAGAVAAVVIAAARRLRDRTAWIIAAVSVVALAAWILYPHLAPDVSSPGRAAWMRFFGGRFLTAIAAIAAAVLCRLASRRGGDASGLTAPLDGSPRWIAAADGLKLYGTALVWRLVLTFGGYLLLLLAILGKSVGLAKMLMWALPLGALATGALMFAGIIRYSGQPANSPGRPAAIFAAAAMGIGLLIEFYVLTLVLGAIGDRPRDYEALRSAREAMETAQSLGPWTLALSFAALASLLFSFAAIAARLADPSLTRRIYGLGGWLLAIGTGAVALKAWLGEGMKRSELGTVVVFALLVAVAALAVLIAYIGLVRDIESRLRHSGEGASVPTAVAREE